MISSPTGAAFFHDYAVRSAELRKIGSTVRTVRAVFITVPLAVDIRVHVRGAIITINRINIHWIASTSVTPSSLFQEVASST